MREYTAFISYRHKPLDIAVAAQLHRLIEHYRVPSEYAASYEHRRLGYVFRDQDELPVSSDLSANIQQALDHSRFLIVVCTPDTPASIWVEREIRYFLKHHDRDHVLAVLADGRPEEAFPALLVHEYDDEGNVTGRTEPLAANIANPASNQRRVMRNLNREAIRIYAALIGCPYDALFQRARRWRVRRLAAIGGVALAIALAYIAMLSVKNGQITRQNVELLEQKRRIQLSQSQLLAQQAERALEAGDYVAAMRDSVNALPADPEDTRPYCPDAERALLATTDVLNGDMSFQTYRHLLDAKTVELASPVRDAAFNASGSMLYAVDDYGNVSAIDPLGGDVLWQTSALEDMRGRPSYLKLRLFEAKGCLLVASDTEVNCLSLSDGSRLWRYEKLFSPIDLFALDEESNLVAFVDSGARRRKDDSLVRDFDVVFLRADTGKQFRRVNLLRESAGITLSGSRGYDAERIQNALFLNGGRAFAGLYFDYIDDEAFIFTVDLEEGTSRLLRREASDYKTPFFHLDTTPDGAALVALRRCGEDNRAASIMAISLDSGEIIAEGTTGEEAEDDFIGNPPCHVLRGEKRLLLSVGKHLYALDPQTCECTAAVALYDALTAIEWVDERVFGYTLANGYYALGWVGGDDEFHDSQNFGVTFTLGANIRSALGGGGFIRPRLDGSRIMGVECGAPGEGFGYVLSVADETSLQIMLIRPLSELALPAWEELPFPEADYWLDALADNRCMRLCGDRATLIESKALDDGGRSYRISVMDMQTDSVVNRLTLQKQSDRELWPFSDASGAFSIAQYKGDLSVVNPADGESTPLASSEEVALSVHDDVQYVAYDACAATGYLEGDGRLLTAWCDGKRLRWWLDGEEQPAAALPGDIVWQVSNQVQYKRMLAVSPGGMILLSDFGTDSGEDAMAAIAAYDTAADRWLRVGDAARGSADRVFAAGRALPRVATLDADGCLRSYDMEAGELLGALRINLPQSYVTQIQFILDDSFLLLRMEDDRLSIYSLESGDCVYRGELEQYARQPLNVDIDSEGRRVYLIDTGLNKGVVLDRDSWTELARLKDACCFDPRTDALYTVAYSSADNARRLFRHRVPDLWELTESVRDSLDG